MAIRRCPYCKAIIDEQDKYCDNCGTQLLFPEDEFVEEEIPGDKIVEEEESEEEPGREDTGEEQELEGELEDEEEFIEGEDEEEETESELTAQDLDDTGEEEAGEVAREREELAGSEEEEEEEKELIDKVDALEKLSEEEARLEEGEEAREEIDREREEEEVEEEEEEFGRPGVTGTGEPVEPQPSLFDSSSVESEFGPAKGGEAEERRPEESEPEGRAEREEHPDKMYEVSIEEDELVFKTKDMARLTGTGAGVITGKKPIPDTGSLPPWVSRIRETPATVEPDEETEAEPTGGSREWTADSGIGVPERITQALPFADTGSPVALKPGQEKDQVEEEREDVIAEEEEAREPVSFSLKLRAKAVDWIFVTALWVISLYFTAQVVGVSFFRLLFGSPLPVLAFYVILLVLYFFLFLYFLGETLGDHYFSE